MSRRVHRKAAAFLAAAALSLVGLIAPVQAAVIFFDFNGTGTAGATVHATMGLDSAVTTANQAFTLANVSSFSVQFTNSNFTALGSALPASLSGQMSNGPSPVFSSLFLNDSLTTFNPSFTGTNNVQFFGANGQTWQMATSGFAPIGTGTWTVAPVPIPAAVWLFGSGLVGLVGLARRKMNRTAA